MFGTEKLIVGGIVVAAVLGGVLIYGEKRFSTGRATERAAYEQAAEAQRELVRGKNAKQETRAKEADREQVRRAKVAEAAAGAARAELDRLRDEINSRRDLPGPSTCAGELERARTAERLLGTCASRYSDVARRADQVADQLRGLQELTPQKDDDVKPVD
jgi:hypothetical protein